MFCPTKAQGAKGRGSQTDARVDSEDLSHVSSNTIVLSM